MQKKNVYEGGKKVATCVGIEPAIPRLGVKPAIHYTTKPLECQGDK